MPKQEKIQENLTLILMVFSVTVIPFLFVSTAYYCLFHDF